MKTLLVYCHPDPTSYTAAVRDAAVSGLLHGGHEVKIVDLYEQGFEPVLSAAEHADHLLANASGKLDVREHIEDLQWCESLVLVYPTWWAGQPAMLKGWIDRVWVSGVAWHLPDGADRLQPLLLNVRRITAVTTHGSTKLINAVEGEAGKRTVTRSLRLMCNRRCRTRWIAFYNIDRAQDRDRVAFLQRVTRLLAK